MALNPEIQQPDPSLIGLIKVLSDPDSHGYVGVDYSPLVAGVARPDVHLGDLGLIYVSTLEKPVAYLQPSSKHEMYGLIERKYVMSAARSEENDCLFEGILLNLFLQTQGLVLDDLGKMSSEQSQLHANSLVTMEEGMPVGVVACMSSRLVEEGIPQIDTIRVYFPEHFSLALTLREFMGRREMGFSLQ